MNVSDEAQEALERCWVNNREKKCKWKMTDDADEAIVSELVAAGCASIVAGEPHLTDEGWEEARGCVRRHRLAERLLADVLDVKKDMLHEVGCRFEHVLQKHVEENICTLLGHPRRCPHGRPIPEGGCCADNERRPRQLVLPLSECQVHEKGTVAYIRTDESRIMNKLTAMGILPGLAIELLGKKPSYLFRIGESQFAVDRKLADHIHIRLS